MTEPRTPSPEPALPSWATTDRSRRGLLKTAVQAFVAAEIVAPLAAFGINLWQESHPSQSLEAGQGIELNVRGQVGWVRDAQVQFGTAVVWSNDPDNPQFVPSSPPQPMKVIRVLPIYNDRIGPANTKVRMDTHDIFVTAEEFSVLQQDPTTEPMTHADSASPFIVSGRQQTALYTHVDETGSVVPVFSVQSLILESVVPYIPHIVNDP